MGALGSRALMHCLPALFFALAASPGLSVAPSSLILSVAPHSIPPSQAGAYGRCVEAGLEGVRRDLCAKEFAALVDCVRRHAGKGR